MLGDARMVERLDDGRVRLVTGGWSDVFEEERRERWAFWYDAMARKFGGLQYADVAAALRALPPVLPQWVKMGLSESESELPPWVRPGVTFRTDPGAGRVDPGQVAEVRAIVDGRAVVRRRSQKSGQWDYGVADGAAFRALGDHYSPEDVKAR